MSLFVVSSVRTSDVTIFPDLVFNRLSVVTLFSVNLWVSLISTVSSSKTSEKFYNMEKKLIDFIAGEDNLFSSIEESFTESIHEVLNT